VQNIKKVVKKVRMQAVQRETLDAGQWWGGGGTCSGTWEKTHETCKGVVVALQTV
jgi:hypothetical protein